MPTVLRAEQALAANEELRAEIEGIVEARRRGPRVLNLIQVFENAGLGPAQRAPSRNR